MQLCQLFALFFYICWYACACAYELMCVYVFVILCSDECRCEYLYVHMYISVYLCVQVLFFLCCNKYRCWLCLCFFVFVFFVSAFSGELVFVCYWYCGCSFSDCFLHLVSLGTGCWVWGVVIVIELTFILCLFHFSS